MIWFPSLSSWLKAVLFAFITSFILLCVKLMAKVSFISVALISEDINQWLTALTIFNFCLIPILLYGYGHYILFGQERKSVKWLISWQSLGEGIWAWIIGVFCVMLTFIVVTGFQVSIDEVTRCIRTPAGVLVKYKGMSNGEITILGWAWFIIAAYFYHWRDLLTKRLKEMLSKKAN